jgi:hypothetical protein
MGKKLDLLKSIKREHRLISFPPENDNCHGPALFDKNQSQDFESIKYLSLSKKETFLKKSRVYFATAQIGTRHKTLGTSERPDTKAQTCGRPVRHPMNERQSHLGFTIPPACSLNRDSLSGQLLYFYHIPMEVRARRR